MTQMGGQISWLIPGALVGLVASLWITRRSPRTDRTRASFLLFGGWLLLMGAVFSFSKGIIHPYCAIALAPPIGALVGMGASTLWGRRRRIFSRLVLAAGMAGSVAWAFVILDWSPHWYPSLRWVTVTGGGLAALAVVFLPRARRFLVAGIGGVGLAAVVAAPAAYSLDTAATPHSGAIPSAGPAIQSGVSAFGGLPGPGGAGRPRLGGFGGPAGGGGFRGGAPGSGALNQILGNINQRRLRASTVASSCYAPNGTTLPNGLHLAPGVLGRLARGLGGGRNFGGAAGGGLLNAGQHREVSS